MNGKIVAEIPNIFFEMSTHRGKKSTFLRMEIELTDYGKVNERIYKGGH